MSDFSPLHNPDLKISYQGLTNDGDAALSAFTGNREAYLTRLLELVVFKPYLSSTHDSNWWQNHINTAFQTPSAADMEPVSSLAHDVLQSVIRYQDISGVKPAKYEDYKTIADTLAKVLGQCDQTNVAPVLKIVAADYLGLAYRQMALNESLDEAGKKALAGKAIAALTQCYKLAETYDDPQLPLWQGYSLFNLARLTTDYEDKTKGEGMLSQATSIRRRWMDSPIVTSQTIKDGLTNEYLYASGLAIQAKLQAVDEATQEYQRLKTSSQSNLSQHVNDLWNKTLASAQSFADRIIASKLGSYTRTP